jgi:hypothetical protein
MNGEGHLVFDGRVWIKSGFVVHAAFVHVERVALRESRTAHLAFIRLQECESSQCDHIAFTRVKHESRRASLLMEEMMI